MHAGGYKTSQSPPQKQTAKSLINNIHYVDQTNLPYLGNVKMVTLEKDNADIPS